MKKITALVKDLRPSKSAKSAKQIQPPIIDATEDLIISLDPPNTKDTIFVLQKSDMFAQVPLYTGDLTPISGHVKINPKKNRKYEFLSLRVELVGIIEFYPFKEVARTFLCVSKHFEMDGIAEDAKTCAFNFEGFPKKYETYNGHEVQIRYFVKAILFNGSYQIAKGKIPIGVQIPQNLNRHVNLFEIQVGVPDAIDILVNITKLEYYLDESIIGKVTFNMLKVDLSRVELILIKRESYDIDNKEKSEDEIIIRTELKQGHPKKGEMIPIKVHLSPLNLSPTISKQEEKVGVSYFLKLALCNKCGPAFFRRIEIRLYRRENVGPEAVIE